MKWITRKLLAYYGRRVDAYEAKLSVQSEAYRQKRWPNP